MQLVTSWEQIQKRLENINDANSNSTSRATLSYVSDNINNFLSDVAENNNFDLIDIFTKDVLYKNLRDKLSLYNIQLCKSNDIYYIDVNNDGKNLYKMTVDNGKIVHEIEHRGEMTVPVNEDDNNNEINNKEKILFVLIVVIILIIISIVAFFLYQYHQTQQAKLELEKGVENEIDHRTDGKQVPDESTKIIDADGKEHYEANKTTDEQLKPTSDMEQARYIEDHPNENYSIVIDGKETKILNPQATINANGEKVITYYNTETKSYETKTCEEISGKITYNNGVVSDKVIDAMCVSDVDSSGNVVYNNITENVKINQHDGQQSIVIEWKTQDGTSIKTFDNDNIVCKNGTYGTITDGKFSPFPDNIQQSVKNTISKVSSTYSMADMSKVINNTNVANISPEPTPPKPERTNDKPKPADIDNGKKTDVKTPIVNLKQVNEKHVAIEK